MTEFNNSNIYESIDLNLKSLLTSGESLTFLVGAGISIEPPAELMSAWQIMKAILKFSAAPEAVDKILNIKNLRFEFLIELFREKYDPDLKLLNYFEEATQPNVIHSFLAEQIRNGQFVMTTNFDTLIERAVGLTEENLQIVITRKDFEEYSYPQQNWSKGKLMLYKLHGSLTNAKTGADTRDSVITTLDALGKHKEGEIFAVETFKRPLFEKIGQDRTLIVMGYSGGDDFDIVPTLLQMQGLKRVIWIAHMPHSEEPVKSYRLKPPGEQQSDPKDTLKREDQVLQSLGRTGVEVVKVCCHTASLITPLIAESLPVQDQKTTHNIAMWLEKNYSPPREGIREEFTAKVFYTYKVYTDAMNYYQKALDIYENLDNHIGRAEQLSNMGIIYRFTGKPQQALEHFQKSFDIYEDLDNDMGRASQLGNMGIIYLDTGEPQKSLECHQKSLEINERLGNLIGMANALGNMGMTYREVGKPQQALECHQKSLEINERLGNLIGMANALGNMGYIYREVGKLQQALENHQKSFEIHERLGNWTSMAHELNCIGVIYQHMGETLKALEFHQRSYDINERLGSLWGMAANLTGIALIHQRAREFQEALENFQHAYDIFKRLGDRASMAVNLNNIGEVLQEMNEPQQALDYFQRSYNIFDQMEHLEGRGHTLAGMGLTYRDLGEFKQALELCQQSYEIFKKLGYTRQMDRVANYVADVKKLLDERD
ncbi:MAG: tetratricopeptide repeat protein [Promethearchaeota archaeon]